MLMTTSGGLTTGRAAKVTRRDENSSRVSALKSKPLDAKVAGTRWTSGSSASQKTEFANAHSFCTQAGPKLGCVAMAFANAARPFPITAGAVPTAKVATGGMGLPLLVVAS